jgi:hypothetical protein
MRSACSLHGHLPHPEGNSDQIDSIEAPPLQNEHSGAMRPSRWHGSGRSGSSGGRPKSECYHVSPSSSDRASCANRSSARRHRPRHHERKRDPRRSTQQHRGTGGKQHRRLGGHPFDGVCAGQDQVVMNGFGTRPRSRPRRLSIVIRGRLHQSGTRKQRVPAR